MTALVHGPLAGQGLTQLTNRSVLLHTTGIYRFVSKRGVGQINVAATDVKLFDRMDAFTYIGERGPDGVISAPVGGWTSNPVPGRMVEVTFADGEKQVAQSDFWSMEPDDWWISPPSNDCRIVAFSLIEDAKPECAKNTGELKSDATPAAVDDGLETFGQVIKSGDLDHVFVPNDGRTITLSESCVVTPVVTRQSAATALEAAKAEIAGLNGDLDRVIAERDRNWEEFLAERQSRMEHGAREAGYIDKLARAEAEAADLRGVNEGAVACLRHTYDRLSCNSDYDTLCLTINATIRELLTAHAKGAEQGEGS